MRSFKTIVLPIFLTGIWINISETIRWIFLIEDYWIEYYDKLDLIFPNEPINTIIWVIWGFLFATIIFALSKKFNLLITTILSWFAVFVMMWLVVWNVGVLPVEMLWYNVPLSLFETFIGAIICKTIVKDK